MGRSSKITVKWANKSSFEASVDKFETRWIDEVRRIIRETAELIEWGARMRVPIDTGDLKKSITTEISNHGLTAKVTVGEYYGIYVEFGTGIYAVDGDGRKTPWVYRKNGQYYWTQGNLPQPYFFPAIETAAEFFRTEIDMWG